MVYKFYDNKSRDTVTSATHTWTVIASDTVSKDQQLIKELYKPIIRKFRKPKVFNIWSADLADMQLISKFNKGFDF